jgi:hypothetical protein
MSKNSMITAGLTIIAVGLIFSTAPAAWCAVGDVINQIPCGKNWAGGGITWRDGYIWEHLRGNQNLYQRDPSTGQTVGSVSVSNDRGVTIAWDSTRGTWWMTEPYVHGMLQFAATGGRAISHFEPGFFESDIAYDPQFDRIWIGDNQMGTGNSLSKWSPEGWRDGAYIDPGFNVQGVAVAGNHLWISNFTDGGHNNRIYQLNKSDGSLTGVSFQTPDDQAINALTFDGRYLWAAAMCASCSGLMYQIDIGYATPTPAISPTPTPPCLVFDSADYDGNGTADIAVFRPSSGLWAVKGITNDYFGTAGDVPAPGDYDGDGTTDFAIHRGSSNLWIVKDFTKLYFGTTGDSPVPGDYDGDGRGDIAVFRNSSGRWLIRGITSFHFGKANDIPVPGYYEGGRTKVAAIFRPSSAFWALRDIRSFFFGMPGDRPVPAPYDVPGRWRTAIFRPSSGLWVARGFSALYFGTPGDSPVPADYEGNRLFDVGIFRKGSGFWAISELTSLYFGIVGDIPVTGRVPIPEK